MFKKSTLYRALAWVLLIIAGLCFLMIIKPGASLFYYERVAETDMIEPEDRLAYRYPLDHTPLLSPASGILMFENNQQLELATLPRVAKKGRGTYALDDSDQKEFIYFSSTDDSDPRTNGNQYILYYPVIFFSRRMGFTYLLILALGLAWVGSKQLKTPAQRQAVKAALIDSVTESMPTNPDWNSIFVLTVAAAYAYAFMEWLFFVTKPSFMDISSFPEKLLILLFTGFIVSMLGIVLLLVLAGIDFILSRLKLPRILALLGVAVPAAIFTAMAFLLLDNFSYTLFQFGVSSTVGFWRGIYALLVLILFIYFYKKIYGFLGLKDNSRRKWQASNMPFFFACGLLILSFALALVWVSWIENVDTTQGAGDAQGISNRPNILLIGGDGLNVDHLSAYGYERDTTPRIQDLAQTSLVAENAFPNAASSAGSVASILTGKLPSQTRVLGPPNILTAADSYQHLPGILRREGYQSVEMGVPHYVDAYVINMQNGFDVVNGRSIESRSPIRFISELGFYDTAYFLSTLSERIESRLSHVFYIRRMENPYTLVTQPTEEAFVLDQERVDDLLDLLTKVEDDPLFVHVHLIGTHGPRFYPSQQVYSAGQEQDENWMPDFYDDSILDFDAQIGEILDKLDEVDLLENTILIIYSDHGQEYTVNDRVPLIFHFPGDEHQGRIQANAQNLDIAPTILDYLDLPQPAWMDGRSLLGDELENQRLIYSMGTTHIQKKIGEGVLVIDVDRLKPPFYQLGMVNINECQRWYRFILEPFSWSSGEIEGHTAPCDEDSLLSEEQIIEALLDHLSDMEFDVSSLRGQ